MPWTRMKVSTSMNEPQGAACGGRKPTDKIPVNAETVAIISNPSSNLGYFWCKISQEIRNRIVYYVTKSADAVSGRDLANPFYEASVLRDTMSLHAMGGRIADTTIQAFHEANTFIVAPRPPYVHDSRAKQESAFAPMEIDEVFHSPCTFLPPLARRHWLRRIVIELTFTPYDIVVLGEFKNTIGLTGLEHVSIHAQSPVLSKVWPEFGDWEVVDKAEALKEMWCEQVSDIEAFRHTIPYKGSFRIDGETANVKGRIEMGILGGAEAGWLSENEASPRDWAVEEWLQAMEITTMKTYLHQHISFKA